MYCIVITSQDDCAVNEQVLSSAKDGDFVTMTVENTIPVNKDYKIQDDVLKRSHANVVRDSRVWKSLEMFISRYFYIVNIRFLRTQGQII